MGLVGSFPSIAAAMRPRDGDTSNGENKRAALRYAGYVMYGFDGELNRASSGEADRRSYVES